MKIVFLLLLNLVFTFSFAQNSQNVGDFNTLEVYDQISAELIQADSNSIEIIGDKSAAVQVVNKNGTLKIRMDFSKYLQGDKVQVKIYFKSLNGVFAREGSSITSENVINSPSLTLNSNKGSVINLNINAVAVIIRLDSGGKIITSGNSESQEIVVNTGGIYEAKDLKSRTANITANAGGEAEIFATDLVNAKVRAGGIININGKPEVNQSILAGGKIKIL